MSIYTRRGIALTRKTRGIANNGFALSGSFDTPTADDMDGDLVLAQCIELTSRHSLADFVGEVVCRNTEIPEAEGLPVSVQENQPNFSGHWTGANDAGHDTVYPKYTGARLETDTCLLLERQLFAKADVQAEDSYARALLEEDDSVLPPSTSFGGNFSVRLCDLPPVAFQQPDWMLHAGDCEHLWTFDWARYVFF